MGSRVLGEREPGALLPQARWGYRMATTGVALAVVALATWLRRELVVEYTRKVARGLGLFSAVEHQEPNELPDDEYPLILTTGRIMFHFHTGSMTRRTDKLDQEAPEAYVEIHPKDAAHIGLNGSRRVRVASRRGEIETRAWITRRVSPGMVFVPFHFAEAAANVLTNPALDPVAKIPETKVCAVEVEKLG